MMIGNIALRPQDVLYFTTSADPNTLRYQVEVRLRDGIFAIAEEATLDEVTALDRAMELCVTVTQAEPAATPEAEGPQGVFPIALCYEASRSYDVDYNGKMHHVCCLPKGHGGEHAFDHVETVLRFPIEGPQGNVADGDKSPESAGIYAEEPTTNVEFRNIEFVGDEFPTRYLDDASYRMDTDLLCADQQIRIAQQIGGWAIEPTDTAAVLAAHDPLSPPPAAPSDESDKFDLPDEPIGVLPGDETLFVQNTVDRAQQDVELQRASTARYAMIQIIASFVPADMDDSFMEATGRHNNEVDSDTLTNRAACTLMIQMAVTDVLQRAWNGR